MIDSRVKVKLGIILFANHYQTFLQESYCEHAITLRARLINDKKGNVKTFQT